MGKYCTVLSRHVTAVFNIKLRFGTLSPSLFYFIHLWYLWSWFQNNVPFFTTMCLLCLSTEPQLIPLKYVTNIRVLMFSQIPTLSSSSWIIYERKRKMHWKFFQISIFFQCENLRRMMTNTNLLFKKDRPKVKIIFHSIWLYKRNRIT